MTRGLQADPDQAGFGVYLHWPFCQSKCPYCDFNSHVRHEPIDEARFIKAYRTNLAAQAALAPNRLVTSIFFGGGTPSLMSPQTVEALLHAVSQFFTLAPQIEITMEANPTSVEAQRLADYRRAGVNRLSIGVQALQDADLKALGRRHTVDEAKQAIALAQRSFERTSFDLIYARPHQSPAAWKDELNRAIDLCAEHLSLYQLTIEPGTIFEQRVRAGHLQPLDDAQARILFDLTQEICEARGLPAYEISNHARPGAESRHNLTYWRYGEYVGVGPGAHARLVVEGQRQAFVQEKHPERWLHSIEETGSAISETEPLSAEHQADEMLLMGLRLREGVLPARYEQLAGVPLDKAKIDTLIGNQLLEWVGPPGSNHRRLRATAQAWPVLNAVIAALV